MKPDDLERYILDHKGEFDDLEAGDELWTGIRDRVAPAPRFKWRKLLWQSAAAIAIFVASWLIHDMVQKGNSGDLMAGDEFPEQMIDERMQELVEAEVFYTERINIAREEIFQLSGNDHQLIKDLDFDLEELEQVFEDLKDDLKDDGDNQEVIEAMIQNYRIKLEILEEMLRQMKKNTNQVTKTNDYEI